VCRRNSLDDDGDAADLLSRFMAAMDEEDGSELGAMFPLRKPSAGSCGERWPASGARATGFRGRAAVGVG